MVEVFRAIVGRHTLDNKVQDLLFLKAGTAVEGMKIKVESNETYLWDGHVFKRKIKCLCSHIKLEAA